MRTTLTPKSAATSKIVSLVEACSIKSTNNANHPFTFEDHKKPESMFEIGERVSAHAILCNRERLIGMDFSYMVQAAA